MHWWPQIDLYIQLLRRVPYSPFHEGPVPELPAATLLDQALELNKFQVTEGSPASSVSIVIRPS